MPSGTPTSGRVVWIVDDSPMELGRAREALAGEYQLQSFSDGSAALEHLAQGPLPDVLVLDWVMPNLSGPEVCQFLRSRPATAELPVLLLTVQQDTAQIVEGLGAGANDYLGKPYAAPELRARVGALMRSRLLREETERAQALLRRVLAQLPDAVVTVDTDQRVVFVNTEGERILGAPAERLIGRKLRELVPDLSLDGPVQSMAGRRAILPDVRLGELSLAPTVSIPPADDAGNTTLILRDVTDARRKEARRVDFYSMVAHDLRSPLSALQMRLQLLRQGHRGPLPESANSELDRMHGGVRELVGMISDFLDVSQIEAGRFRIERQPVEMNAVIGSAIEEYRPLSDARGLRLIQQQGPEAVVEGDPRRLMQVVSNLLSNAIKFTAIGGTVHLQATLEGGAVEVQVRDDGAGIAASALPRLFHKYERVEGPHNRRVEGTGLGLAIVKEIVEAHGGIVGVRSEPGSGSTFWLRLPAASGRA